MTYKLFYKDKLFYYIIILNAAFNISCVLVLNII